MSLVPDRMTPEQKEEHAKWARLMDVIEENRTRRMRRLQQRERRVDLGLGYFIYCVRRFTRRSQTWLSEQSGISRSTISRWERGERIPSIGSLGAVADVAGLELVIGLRDPEPRDPAEEFVLLAVCRGENLLPELDLFHDRYENDYMPIRPWRAQLEKAGLQPTVR